MSRVARAWLLSVAAILACWSGTLAHAELDTADPGPGDSVETAPAVLTATFTEALDPARSSIVVRDAGGDTVARGGVDGSDTSLKTMNADLPQLGPGTYEVRWTTLSAADGDLERGTYEFEVTGAPASPSSSPAPAASPVPTGSPAPTASAGGSPAPANSAAPSASPIATAPPVPSATPGSGVTSQPGGSDVVVPIVIGALAAASVLIYALRRGRR